MYIYIYISAGSAFAQTAGAAGRRGIVGGEGHGCRDSLLASNYCYYCCCCCCCCYYYYYYYYYYFYYYYY